MSDSIQYSLFADTHAQKAHAYFHTPEGGAVMNLFIRIAIGCARRGKRVGAKLIWERLRWHYEIAKRGEYKLNNNYTAYAARFAEERVWELKGYFRKRDVGRTDAKTALVVPIRRIG